mmetsp:Transcript_9638/g.11173  ORF Transcript_9638/g.11173 Transcript_9638/m.11173 type:complete len:253 (+) Transcript_9638:130-888(+)
MYCLRSSRISLLTSLAVIVFFFSDCDGNIRGVHAFSSSKMIRQKKKSSRVATRTVIATTSLSVQSTTTRLSTEPVTEEDAREIFNKARQFAFQDEQQKDDDNNVNVDQYDSHYHSLADEKAQIKESRFWINEIIHLQSGCITGTLVDNDICENQDVVAEIVGKLRSKIKRHEQRLEKRTKGSDSVVPWIATELSIGAIFVIVFAFLITLDIVEKHDDIGPIENYQQFFNILHDKKYFVSMVDRFSQHLNIDA